MNNFNALKRQKYLTEAYYLKAKANYVDNDKYMIGQARRWDYIADSELNFLFLEYTAGTEVEYLRDTLERVIKASYKKSERIAKLHNMNLVGVLSADKAILLYSLAVLLNKSELINDVIRLTNGDDQTKAHEDEFINHLFRIHDVDYPELNGYLFSASSLYHYVLSNAFEEKNKIKAVELLNDSLSDWYKLQKYEFWYNSHLDMENRTSYVGYWCFEAAMLVYLLDLDDSSLHKYVYYPKDIVTWIRSVKPIKAVFESE